MSGDSPPTRRAALGGAVALGARRIAARGVELPHGRRLVDDALDRSETAMMGPRRTASSR